MFAKINYVGEVKQIVQGSGVLGGKPVNLEFVVKRGKIISLWDTIWARTGDSVDSDDYHTCGKYQGSDLEFIKQANKLFQANKSLT